jgi:hypothetical protein
MKRKAVWMSCIVAALFCGRPASASVIITLDQVGPNVVATDSGTVNFNDLTFRGGGSTVVAIWPIGGFLVVGSTGVNDSYDSISGPTTFGTGDFFIMASTGIGNTLGIICCVPVDDAAVPILLVPHGYVSGTELSGTATWDNTTIAALGVTPGIYTWTWGTGANADSLKLFAGVPVPEPGTLGLLSIGAAGLALLKWRFWA